MSSYSQPPQQSQVENLQNGMSPQLQQNPGKFVNSYASTQETQKYFPPASQFASMNNNPMIPNAMPPAMYQQQQPPTQSNHMSAIRPNASLLNGGGSAHSSRTASPALNSSFNQSIPKTHHPPAPSGGGGFGGYVHPSGAGQMPQSYNAEASVASIPGGNQVISNVNANMQNLSITPSITANVLPPPPPSSSQPLTNNLNQIQKPPSNNIGVNYVTSFQSSPVTSTPPIATSQNQMFGRPQNSLSSNSMPSPVPPPPIPAINGQPQHVTSVPHPTGAYPPVSTTFPGKSPAAIHQNAPPQQNSNNQNNFSPYPPQINTQNTVNNNQLQQQQQQFQQNFPPQSQPSQGIRKPLYPSQRPPPQEQPYAQAYQPQAQQSYQQPTFNGQTNNAPLQYQQNINAMSPTPMSVTHQGFNRLWGQDTVDLMQHRHILPHDKVKPPRIILNNQFHESVNCNADIMRCTLTKIPESSSLLQKSRLPLGIVVHPFRDINSLPVIQCPNIVRCRLCRTYINPFVYFVDSKMWKCNLCYRVNELPEDFQYDPATKTYGDVTRRPEVRSSTIEFIAPSEYMLRPPQPAIYLFLFDVSILAQQSGYLEAACSTLQKHLDDMPGDARTRVGFVAYNSELHFYNIAEGYNQPHEMTLVDIDDPFLPCPDNLLVSLHECKELIKDLLTQLPNRFANSHDPGSALGAALQVAYKLMAPAGGRVTVFQTCLPNKGPGALSPREDPNNRSAKDVLHLNPATDFYKRHSLECSGSQIAVDLFLLNQQYSDLATISGVSKYSGGSVYHFPLYQKTKPHHVDSLKQCLKRYLTRKIGFEAVMRIRCTRGLQVHTFHGNFFVRSTDLLSLPNVNPDAAYGMQISYEESLADVKTICFQAALLYTNSEGERRIRVHTLCLPVSSSLCEVMHSADAQSIVSLLGKMAVDRSITTSIADAREAFINATVDILSAFRIAQNLPQGQTGQLVAPKNLSLLPLYISALLKHIAFRTGTSTRLDDRIAAMDAMKTLPLDQLMKFIYPEFYIIDCLFNGAHNSNDTEDDQPPEPPILQLTAEYLDSSSIFLIDCGILVIIYVGLNVPPKILESVFGVQSTADMPDYCYGLPSLNTTENEALKNFINTLSEDKPYLPTIQIIRDTSACKPTFIEKLIDDRSESSLSYYEFLQHLRTQVK